MSDRNQSQRHARRMFRGRAMPLTTGALLGGNGLAAPGMLVDGELDPDAPRPTSAPGGGPPEASGLPKFICGHPVLGAFPDPEVPTWEL